MPRKPKDPNMPPKVRKDARKVPLKFCNTQSLYILLPPDSYPPAYSGALNRAKRAKISDDIAAEMELFIKTGNSPYINLKPIKIGQDWVNTHVIVHIPMDVWNEWKLRTISFSTKNFIQNFLVNNV